MVLLFEAWMRVRRVLWVRENARTREGTARGFIVEALFLKSFRYPDIRDLASHLRRGAEMGCSSRCDELEVGYAMPAYRGTVCGER